jgi:hypothetical protein
LFARTHLARCSFRARFVDPTKWFRPTIRLRPSPSPNRINGLPALFPDHGRQVISDDIANKNQLNRQEHALSSVQRTAPRPDRDNLVPDGPRGHRVFSSSSYARRYCTKLTREMPTSLMPGLWQARSVRPLPCHKPASGRETFLDFGQALIRSGSGPRIRDLQKVKGEHG